MIISIITILSVSVSIRVSISISISVSISVSVSISISISISISDHQNRSLKAFEEHIRNHGSSCFATGYLAFIFLFLVRG